MRPKLINIVAHAAGWTLFFSLVIAFVVESSGGQSIVNQVLSFPFLAFCLIYLFLFYLNAYLLIPKLYLRKIYIFYFIAIGLLFIAVYFIKPFDDLLGYVSGPGNRLMPPLHGEEGPRLPSPDRQPRHTDIVSIILFITIWSLSTAICIIRQWRISAEKASRAEADKINAELSFLKTQINPHFLFNTLNNIYSLAVTGSKNTAPGIMKLSNIMRYVTDEVRQDFVSLQYEVNCMTDYIDLQKMRLGENTNVQFALAGSIDDKKIAPLILMTFVENVFKHGISSHEASDIIIKLMAEKHTITFFCRNKLFETKKNAERTGIGIDNTSKRLQHLYPNKHFLSIDSNNGFFTVQLTLQV